ncbi:MAG TPA: FHA domain-containing protein [Polyangiaceae bacterium]|nr:FHA domain-containing protein [Polyangiaceae bacterium]
MVRTEIPAKVAVFAIVISEKGGAERREAFDHAEINIGRVQGNDLMLAKGNVSKRHARLVFRDNRFIVTDLNSTNGTYVNRRRISQATIVRQGDRIYIGDFVLRVEGTEDGSGLSPAPASVQPAGYREPMMTNPDAPSRSKAPGAPPPPPQVYPAVPPAPRLPTAPTDSGRPSMSSPAPISSTTSNEPSVVERLPVVREESIDTETTAYRSAVSALVERVSSRLGAGFLDRPPTPTAIAEVERTMTAELGELRREEVVGASIAEERLRKDARAELIELGSIGPLLLDDTVTAIAVTGPTAIIAVRGGRRVAVEPPLSSEASVRRVLGRLSRAGGAEIDPAESVVSRKLPNGFRLSAITGARALSGTLFRLERPQRVDKTLDDLVRAGAVSRAMATFLRHCVAVRANILIAGPRDAKPTGIAGALVSASTDGHVVALQTTESIVSNSVNVSHVDLADAGAGLESLVGFAARLPDARLVVDSFSGAAAVATLDAVAQGADGLIAVLPAASLRRGLGRLPAELSAIRPGLAVGVAKEWLAGTFDVFVEVARLRDGRQRVVRIAEPVNIVDGDVSLRDIFTFVVERTATGGSVEGTFQATGVAPRVVADMAARGIHVDSGVFSRPPSR